MERTLEEYTVGRNKTMDYVIGLPMVFLLIGGLYLFFEGRSSTYYLSLVLLIVSPITLSIILFHLIRNQPYVVLSAKGIYLKSIHRVIPWQDVQSISVEEEDIPLKESPGAGLSSMKYYFVVTEITERRADGNYGHDRKICINFTNRSADELLSIGLKYYRFYLKS